MTEVRWARFADLTPYALYALLRLRIAVFTVEQHCVYQDLDGRDTEPETWHAWVEDGGEVVAYLRVLGPPGGEVVGRVVTAPTHRDRGLARVLMNAAIDRCARPVRIEAQSYLLGWYGAFGFVPCGPEYLEDGIPHTPMVLG
ncbi:MAG TPA: GNAT family N-acetyltransferase [Frankiaceae bacterium]|nr:GNAT family N-acetyltransferase [Frankiaceae bacterium]